MEAIAIRVEAIAIRVEAIAGRKKTEEEDFVTAAQLHVFRIAKACLLYSFGRH